MLRGPGAGRATGTVRPFVQRLVSCDPRRLQQRFRSSSLRLRPVTSRGGGGSPQCWCCYQSHQHPGTSRLALALGPKGSVACLPASSISGLVFQMLLLAKLVPASTHLSTGSCEIVSCPAASVPVPENLCLGHGRLLPTAWRFRPATGFAVRAHMGSNPTFRFISCFCTNY